jgi:hypothetical protein
MSRRLTLTIGGSVTNGRFIVLAIVLAACTPGAATSSLAPTPSAAPLDTSAPASIGACIDRGLLADGADTVTVAMSALTTALTASNVQEATTLAGTAATGMRSLANLAAPARPDAQKDLLAAADELDAAKSGFPGGVGSIQRAQTDWDQGLALARAGACPG